MLTVCYAAKGGQGATTVTAALAVIENCPMVIDAAGDLPAALGLPEPTRPGLADLLTEDGPLNACAVAEAAEITPGAALLSTGGPLDGVGAQRWAELAGGLAADRRHWLVDAGIGPATAMLAQADRAFLAVVARTGRDVPGAAPTGSGDGASP